jgi:hypothetical protein
VNDLAVCANTADEAARVRLGAGTRADVMVALAEDPLVTVRAALALNRPRPTRR